VDQGQADDHGRRDRELRAGAPADLPGGTR
jgi:hypothetical protein